MAGVSGFSISFRVARKPALFDALALCEQFADTPERRSAPYGEQRRPKDLMNQSRPDDSRDAHYQKPPPTTRTEAVLAFDDQRVKEPDNQKSSDADC